MERIADTQIAKEANRSPQVIHAMKKAYPAQYAMLKLATRILQSKREDERHPFIVIDLYDYIPKEKETK